MTVTGSFTGAYVSAPREGSSASFLHGVAWGEAGEGAAGAKPPPPVQSPPFLTQVESRSAYSLPAGSHFGLIFLLTSPAFPPLESALIDLR